MKGSNPEPLLLSGRLVHVDGTAHQRYLLIRDGRIVWLGGGRPPAALIYGAREVVAGPRAWIFPGLLNLHTHASYNILPLWHSRKAPFANRFEWRADPGYRADIAGRLAGLKGIKGLNDTLAVVSELQAIAGGTTVLDQPNRLDDNAAVPQPIVLCRDTGRATDLGLSAGMAISSVVDFFSPQDGLPTPKRDKGGTALIDGYAKARDGGRLGGLILHLAEGRSGYGSHRGVDPYSRAEFEAFVAHPAMRDVDRVRAVPLTLVHASGVDPRNPAHLEFLRVRGISIVWSPVSNLLLYGDTLDIPRFLDAGINIALGSDWSPSGSKHVWEEAKFARRLLDAVGSTVSDAAIFRMLTINAARCLGTLGLGRTDEGAFADLFILESQVESDSALEVFFATGDRDVLATIVNGVPIYGRRTFLKQFDLPLQSLPRREGSAARDKAVHLPPSIGIDLASAIDEIEERLKGLTRPTMRSNLLASSDKPYQRRMQRLRGAAEFFGWTAKQTEKKASRSETPSPGEVRVPPNSARVWCGFMSGSNRDQFLAALGSVFIPATVALMRDLGLTAYFPAVPPAGQPADCPDEVAIVFYESQKVYDDAKRSVGGRLYGVLHSALFRYGAGGSWSAFPEPLSAPLRSRAAYHLFSGPVDWYVGTTRLHIGRRDPSKHDVATFHNELHRACERLMAQPGCVDAAILAVDDAYFSFWDHRPDSAPKDDGLGARFVDFSQPVMEAEATPVSGDGPLYEPWPGFPVRGGDCLRLVFERRALFPW